MIQRQNRLVIAFRTTTEAMAMERCCREGGMPGRLIPLPRSISAGCGLAWCAAPEDEARLREFMQRQGIGCQEIHLCLV